MKDKMREPNLDPNSCTDINLVGFKYLKFAPIYDKEKWVERQMTDKTIVNDIIFHAEGPYNWLREKFCWDGKTFDEREKERYNYCKMFLERKWDELFKEESEKGRNEKAEWVKEQMSDPRHVAVLVQTCYQENAFARKLPEIDEEDLCRRFLSRAYDKIKPNI
ncbi:hypothetical protein UFOVP457_16 [uncultured Caudovirales phage]|uniref:Uncharacterized protein n=1 Tax=uncultured Caudovirales phage TaxID=2100421 RepID=A0A6J5MF43_9CAUD|nr:hypothetical protein UFOVP457_16 [uncultured Caudovirales phage]